MLESRQSQFLYWDLAFKTRFGPLRPSSSVYKLENASAFVTGLLVAIDTLLLILSCTSFLHVIAVFRNV
jgi:hypothetical protein